MSQSPEIHTQNKVRNLIYVYENQTSINGDDSFKEQEQKIEVNRSRAKSIGNLFSLSTLFRKSKAEINSIIDIEKELVKLDAHLYYYQIYDKETHVAFQEQLFNVLTSIVIIDSKGDESVSQKKKELVNEVQRLVAVLNLKLPFGVHKNEGTQEHKVQTKNIKYKIINTDTQNNDNYTNKTNIRVVSTNGELTPAAVMESKEIQLREIKSAINGIENNEEHSSIEAKAPALQDVEPNLIPSVSILKQRFQKQGSSTEHREQQVTEVTSASYSGLSRSQSMKVVSKTNDFKIVRPERQLTTTDEIPEVKSSNIEEINENDYKDELVLGNSSQEPEIGLVSVHRLRSLFEVKNKESCEGNYLNNCIGLLRSTSKSKSMGNLYVPENSIEHNEYLKKDSDVQNAESDDKGLVMTISAVPIELYNKTEDNLENTSNETLAPVISAPNNEEHAEDHIINAIEDVTGNANMVIEVSSEPTSYSTISTVSSGGNGGEASVHSVSYTSSSRSHQSSHQETRTVMTSSSTSHISQSMQITESPVSYSTITYSNGQKVTSVTGNNGENSKNGSEGTSIEDVTEEYFRHADVPQNVDEEFNKLVETSDISPKIEPF